MTRHLIKLFFREPLGPFLAVGQSLQTSGHLARFEFALRYGGRIGRRTLVGRGEPIATADDPGGEQHAGDGRRHHHSD